MSNPKTHAYRVAVAVAFGLIGFGVNFLDIQFMEGATFKISILAGLFFPLVVALAWGWRYGLLSALAGGCQTMWWLWYGDGWGVLYSVPVFTLWIVWHGWWAERRSEGHPWYVSSFAVEIPFRIVIELGFLVVFRWLVSLNPPPWNPAVAWDHVSLAWLQTVAVKHVVTAYILLMAAYVTLSVGPVRRFFALPSRPGQRDTTAIYAGAVLFGLLLWALDALVDYFVFPREGQTFWSIAVHGADEHEVFMRSVYVAAALLGGIVLARLNCSRAVLQETLDHQNRILAAIRNVNQLIVREKDPHRLLDEACRLLVETRGYYNAWIVLMADGSPKEPFFHAGFHGDFTPMAERLRAGNLPICAQAVLSSGSMQVKDDPPAQCRDCPLSSSYAGRTALALRLEHAGQVFGWMSLSCPAGFARSAEDHVLMKEVAGDIAFALWAIETEAQRETLARKYAAVLASTIDAVTAVDLNGRITVFNSGAEKLFGCMADEALGTSIARFCPEDRLEEQAGMLCRVRDEGTVAGYESERLTADGRRIPVEITLGLNTDAGGRPLGINAIMRNITERKRAEEQREKLQAQLNQAQKMESVGRLAGGVAHDFNNMLTIILGHADMILEQMDPDQPFHDDLMEIRNTGERSADLTRKLLAFARKQTIAPKVIDLNETIEIMLNMLRRLIGEDIDLVWQPAAHIWPVKMDPAQIDQILANLCVNARDAIAGVGKLTIETDKASIDEEYCSRNAGFVPGEYVLLVVSDNGCGMDSETMSQLFEPFFTTKELGEGTGLGLPTVYGVVKQNNGFINVYSEPDQGTTFRIYLPRHLAKAGFEKKESRLPAAARGNEFVLLVEDEPAILKMTIRMLEREGYTVIGAGTPGEAIRLASEHAGNIHLLMTDVVMPEMNGRDLAQNILSLYPHLKCLFMSGYTANVIAHHGVLDEGVYFIQKPFSKRDLTVKVREVLDEAK